MLILLFWEVKGRWACVASSLHITRSLLLPWAFPEGFHEGLVVAIYLVDVVANAVDEEQNKMAVLVYVQSHHTTIVSFSFFW